MKKHLVVIGHPDKKSFCYNGIFKTIVRELTRYKEEFEVIDLYDDKLHRDRTELIKDYKRLVTLSPLTPMATHFHIKNGAKQVHINDVTQNFEYKIV